MHGAYMGGLRVYAFEKRRNDAYGHEILLWEKYGNQGNRWNEKMISYKPKRNVEVNSIKSLLLVIVIV